MFIWGFAWTSSVLFAGLRHKWRVGGFKEKKVWNQWVGSDYTWQLEYTQVSWHQPIRLMVCQFKNACCLLVVRKKRRPCISILQSTSVWTFCFRFLLDSAICSAPSGLQIGCPMHLSLLWRVHILLLSVCLCSSAHLFRALRKQPLLFLWDENFCLLWPLIIMCKVSV